jgi:hypothetical protein
MKPSRFQLHPVNVAFGRSMMTSSAYSSVIGGYSALTRTNARHGAKLPKLRGMSDFRVIFRQFSGCLHTCDLDRCGKCGNTNLARRAIRKHNYRCWLMGLLWSPVHYLANFNLSEVSSKIRILRELISD